jgi:putative colanic acid biosysnthesis UDP-glucose lipid carrier transferase
MSSVIGSIQRQRVRIGNVEPAIVTLLRQLDPLIVVLSLFICEVLSNQRLSPGWAALVLLTFIISSQLFGQLEARDSSRAFSSFSGTYVRKALQWLFVVAMLLLSAYAFKVSHLLPRRVFLTWFVVTPVALSITHALRAKVQAIAERGTTAPRHIIIGANEAGLELARRLPAQGFMGYFDFRSTERVSHALDARKLIGHCREAAEYVRANNISQVYIALPMSNVPRIHELINALRDTTASIYFVPDTFAFDLIQARVVEINGMPALSVCDTPFYGMDAVLKRATDLTLGGLIMVLTLPLMAVIALAVKLNSRGPALFRQRRYGLNGEEITVFKFRSMTCCEDGSVVTQARRFDPRVTVVGRFIRKTSLDELPQIFNVLQGKMSLVGPRPHAVAHNELYRKLINGYMIRHKVRPGITGWAQVNGLRGETETLEKMSERVHYDLEYLRAWSPWLDIKILAMTLAVVVRGQKNAH